jgi:Flp pilus assembly protein TadD
MRRLANSALPAALLLALTACGTADNPPAAPSDKGGAEASTAPPTLSAAQQRKACVDAWAATIGARPTDFNSETDTDPTPDACAGLPESDSLDAYMDGLQQSNKAGQDALQKAIEDAASADTSSP